MAEEREPTIGIEVEEHPERRFDLLHVKLPVPRLLILPEETRQHLRAARRERLLALRSLLEAAIQRLDEPENPPRKTRRAGGE